MLSLAVGPDRGRVLHSKHQLCLGPASALDSWAAGSGAHLAETRTQVHARGGSGFVARREDEAS